ncbi:glycosyltransferase [Shouchella miscanthi]|uniref:Glycosyltransferase n=1 Tax=Shouchella miscanthi TaxID=2598861 RepID=A0ABU6NSD7_9BACI|nr:glycosyltransferase [Shouchella miscanthi]MED4130343.1 glycosyltransferase [Shouchella miscanthi]
MNKIKVCHITEAGGGVQRHINDINVYASNIDIEHCFIISPVRNNFVSKNNDVYHLKMNREIGIYDLKSMFNLYKLIKKINPDVIHCHSSKSGGLVRGIKLLGLLKRIKIVYSAHGFYFNEYSNKFKNLIYINIEKVLGFKTDIIVGTCNSEHKLVIDNKIASEKKAIIIENGIDTEAYKRLNKQLNPKAPVLLFVGRLSRQKNIKILLESLLALKNEIKDVRLIVIGDGEEMDDARAYCIQNNLMNNVTFEGFVSNLEPYMRKADIVVMPSLWEGFPYFLLESLIQGKPVVGGNVTGIKDVITPGLNGFLCDPSDSENLTNSIIECLESVERKGLTTDNCISSIKGKFEVTKMVNELEKTYITITN